MYGFGKNVNGQLGLGDKLNRRDPTVIPGLEHIVAIACGQNHTLCVNGLK